MAGVSAPGLKVHCRNEIPHSRGMGSSASAVVGGLAAAAGLVQKSGSGRCLTAAELVQLSAEFEGHPDNAAASVLGGAVVSWTERSDTAVSYHASRLEVLPALRVFVFIPTEESSTEHTRGLLPDLVPRADAVFNLSRTALAVVGLTRDASVLLTATDDKLHQPYRREAYPKSSLLVEALRTKGIAGAISGAGPTVLALTVDDLPAEFYETPDFELRELSIGAAVSVS